MYYGVLPLKCSSSAMVSERADGPGRGDFETGARDRSLSPLAICGFPLRIAVWPHSVTPSALGATRLQSHTYTSLLYYSLNPVLLGVATHLSR